MRKSISDENVNEQYKCQSYYDDDDVLQDCTCGKCMESISDELDEILDE